MHSLALLSSSLLMLGPAVKAEAMYGKSSPVMQVDNKSYDRLIARSNYTSIVEFYAPWCGHCKNLKPAFEKAAQSLSGIANVAAVDCDDDANRGLCGSMGVQGFPTLKIVKPSKQSSKKGHAEDYQGPRTAKGITDAVTDKIFNYVMRLKSSDDFEKFQKKTPDRPKGLIFSEKGLIPAFVKTLAIDFLGGIDFGYVRSGDTELVSKYKIDQFPAVLLLPERSSEPIKFDGDVSKGALVDFFSQIMPPHPNAPSASASSKGSPKSSKSSSSKAKPAAATESLDDDSYPQVPKESPDPNVASDKPKPVQVPVKGSTKVTKLESDDALQKACLHTKSATCILAVIPADTEEESDAISTVGTLTKSLGDIASKHAQRGAKMFPFYTVENTNAEFKALADGLKLTDATKEPQVLAVNAKKGWWASLPSEDLSAAAIETWVDGIRLGDFSKQKIPEGLVKELENEVFSSSTEEHNAESTATEETKHGEL